MVQTSDEIYYYAVGKRKTAVAQVRLFMSRGPIIVNGKPLEEVFPWDSWQRLISEPFEATDTRDTYLCRRDQRGKDTCHGKQAGAEGLLSPQRLPWWP